MRNQNNPVISMTSAAVAPRLLQLLELTQHGIYTNICRRVKGAHESISLEFRAI